jgi:hypothetical protein
VLKKNPRANAAAVNEAWPAAGRPGDINVGLVNHLRFRLGHGGQPAGQAGETDKGRSA